MSSETAEKLTRQETIDAYALSVARACKFDYALVSKFETRCMIAEMMDADGRWIENRVARSRMNAAIQSAARLHCR